jgi:hypothetical protein
MLTECWWLQVKAAVVEKADKRLLQMVSEEITNMRNLYDNREDALRTDMVGNFAVVKSVPSPYPHP